jgi:hypothetical protein
MFFHSGLSQQVLGRAIPARPVRRRRTVAAPFATLPIPLGYGLGYGKLMCFAAKSRKNGQLGASV